MLIPQKIFGKTLSLGMRFSEPLFFDDGNNMFLAAKKPVKQYHLNAIKRWNIEFVVTKGHLLTAEEIAKERHDDIEEIETLD